MNEKVKKIGKILIWIIGFITVPIILFQVYIMTMANILANTLAD